MPTCVTSKSEEHSLRLQNIQMPTKDSVFAEEQRERCDVVDNKTPLHVRHPSSGESLRTNSRDNEKDTSTAEFPMRKKTYQITLWTKLMSVLNFFLFLSIIWFKEIFHGIFSSPDKRFRRGYAPLIKDFDELWNRCFYRRASNCFAIPIDSRPSRVIGIMERVSHDDNATFQRTGKIIPAINLGSYNYLGFADDVPIVTQNVLDCLAEQGLSSCSPPQELGQNAQLERLEKAFANFLGKDDAIVCGMGFSTNFRGLPALFGKGTFVISDKLNHSSIVNGVRSSGAVVKPFKHNEYAEVEKLAREAIIFGQNPSGPYKPWDRIVIIVEGIYSMEGEIVDLKTFVNIKKKYKALLFVDEAHSIGAIGRTGRGVCEFTGVDPKDVDVLMGTFTKSFGSIGGYIASDQSVIDYIRVQSSLALYCDTLSPPCAQQVLSVLDVILGNEGTNMGRKRIAQLKENSSFFRQGLIKRGFTVLGDDSSPVIPVMLFNLSKLPEVSLRCLQRGVAIVIVGYPATSLLEGRIRFCVSAAHTREDLEYTLDVMEDLSKYIYMDYEGSNFFIAKKKQQDLLAH
ncbi:unnamed protein product [Phytomonas sp. EM1]|nr:unnamed protein product [Phytomonas sp. EM1]|eukprot:CCW64767.1 unnamed protein product [Phytomonas sp. isolate EM1]